MDRFRRGDHEAVRELYDLYSRPVFAIALRSLGDRVLADDGGEVLDVHGDRGVLPARLVGGADGGHDHGVDQRGDRAAVHDAVGLVELGPVGQAHPAVVGPHLLELEPDEAREVRAVPATELGPALGDVRGQGGEAVGVHRPTVPPTLRPAPRRGPGPASAASPR